MVAQKRTLDVYSHSMWWVCHIIHITHCDKRQTPQNHLFLFLFSRLRKKTTAGFFANAGSSLLVMHNLDQTIKIIYKNLAIEETIAQIEQLFSFFPVSITPSEEFTSTHSVRLFRPQIGTRQSGYDGRCR